MITNKFPFPWTFKWDECPKIYCNDGRVVCVFSTGTIKAPYKPRDIVELALFILQACEEKTKATHE